MKTMQHTNHIWKELPINRASTPIQQRSTNDKDGPRTSTPKSISNKSSNLFVKKKKKKKKQMKSNDYRLLFTNQHFNRNKHSLQIWFL